MRRYGPKIFAIGSYVILTYLALFLWLDAVLRGVHGGPSPVTGPVAIITTIVALRSLVWPGRISWVLSVAALLGLLIDWHSLFLVLLLPMLAWGAIQRFTGRGTRLGWHRLAPCAVTLSAHDRFMHLHVLGPTGSGKSSSVLMPLIHQDIQQDYALVVMEPKGDLAAATHHEAAQHGRSVIRFDPLSDECPHMNPLAGPPDAAAEGLAWTLNQISDSGHPYYAVAARVQLLYAVRAVISFYGEDADIGSVLAFFRDDALQRQIVRASSDPSVLKYFTEQWARKAGNSKEDRQGLLNRLELLWANPAVRRVLSAPGDFTWDEVLADRWVVAISLSLAEMGESARALGSLLWHGLAQAAYRRNPAQRHPPCYLYLDEFHQWVSEDLSDFLALARGYSVGVVLAHQDMGQLSPALQEAVVANARQRIILPGSAEADVARFHRAAEPFAWTFPLRYLRRGQAMAQLTIDGRLKKPQLLRLDHYGLGEVSGRG